MTYNVFGVTLNLAQLQLLLKYYYNYYYNHFTALGTLSGTTQVSWYQKKHSPTHIHRGHQSSASSIFYDPWHSPCSSKATNIHTYTYNIQCYVPSSPIQQCWSVCLFHASSSTTVQQAIEQLTGNPMKSLLEPLQKHLLGGCTISMSLWRNIISQRNILSLSHGCTYSTWQKICFFKWARSYELSKCLTPHLTQMLM